jgi:hypothetical protein
MPNGEARVVALTGRPEWLLAHLAEACTLGVTARDLPARLRLSGYIHRLRLTCVPIETTYETHNGPFPSHRDCYRLAYRSDRIGGIA